MCSTENVPLNTNLPELMSSELLVDMTTLDSANSDSLADVSAIDSSCNNQSLVLMTPTEANNNDTVVISDNSIQYVLDSSPCKVRNSRYLIKLFS